MLCFIQYSAGSTSFKAMYNGVEIDGVDINSIRCVTQAHLVIAGVAKTLEVKAREVPFEVQHDGVANGYDNETLYSMASAILSFAPDMVRTYRI